MADFSDSVGQNSTPEELVDFMASNPQAASTIMCEKMKIIFKILIEKQLQTFSSEWRMVMYEILRYCANTRNIKGIIGMFTSATHDYILRLFNDKNFNENDHLRYELFSLIAFFHDDLLEANQRKEVWKTLCSLHDSVYYKSYIDGIEISPCVFAIVMWTTKNANQNFVDEFIKDIKMQSENILQINGEIRFLISILEVVHYFAEHIVKKVMERNAAKVPTYFQILGKYLEFFNRDDLMEVWQLPGISSKFASSMISYTEELIKLSEAPYSGAYGCQFKKCIDAIGDNLNKQLDFHQKNGDYSFIKTLRTEYADRIQAIKREMSQNRMDNHLYIPSIKEQTYTGYPTEMNDPVTNRIMTEPVQLQPSNSVVDRSTLFHAILEDGLDPITNQQIVSYSEVRDLSDRIKLWKIQFPIP